MAEESKSTVFYIFLFFIFIFLAVVIFVFIFNAYRSTSNYTTETTKSSVDCTAYSFRIVGGTLSYENETLSFVFDPTLGGAREKNPLVLVVNGEEIETSPVDFTFKQKLKIASSPMGEFGIYPKGCIDLIKNCSVENNRCD